MNLSTFFQLRPSLFFVACFGTSTFILGYFYSQNLPDQPKQLLLSITAPAFILAFLGFVNSTVSKEIEVETEKQLDEKLESKMELYRNQYSEDVKALKQEIFNSNISESERRRILQKFAGFEEINKKFLARVQASQEIVKWLEKKDNRLLLSQFAISKAISNDKFHQKYMDTFEKDILRCVNWLRDSVNSLRACKVDPEKYTSAILAGMDSRINPYITALNAIKDYEPLKRLASNTGIVEAMIDYLIQELSATTK